MRDSTYIGCFFAVSADIFSPYRPERFYFSFAHGLQDGPIFDTPGLEMSFNHGIAHFCEIFHGQVTDSFQLPASSAFPDVRL